MNEQITLEEKREKLENLAMTIDEYMDYIIDDETDETFLPIYRALEAIEKKLGQSATAIRWNRV